MAPGRTSDRGNVKRSFLWSNGWADGGQKETKKLHLRVAPVFVLISIVVIDFVDIVIVIIVVAVKLLLLLLYFVVFYVLAASAAALVVLTAVR